MATPRSATAVRLAEPREAKEAKGAAAPPAPLRQSSTLVMVRRPRPLAKQPSLRSPTEAVAPRPPPTLSRLDSRLARTNEDLHRELSAVPYCLTCKEYVRDFLDAELHDLAGVLEKKKGLFSGWKERWFVLSGCHLAYYESQDDLGKTLPCGVMHLERAPVEDSAPQELTFEVTVKGARYKLRALNIEDKFRWMAALRSHDAAAAASPQAPAGSEPQVFCAKCDVYVPLDLFTLGDADGFVREHAAGAEPLKQWAVLSGDHLALFASPDAVARYRVTRVLHVERARARDLTGAFVPPKAAHRTPGKQHFFTVDGQTTLESHSAAAQDAWLRALHVAPPH